MPKLERGLDATDQLIVRPIAVGIIQEVLVDRMGLPASTKVNFPGYAETVALPRGLISNPNEDTRFPTTNKITIEVTENYVEDWLNSVQTKQPEHIPSFLNTELEVELRPIYASMEMRISIHYRAENKTDARRFYDFMMTKLPNREDTWIHTLNYSYGIPEVYMVILKEIHRLTELQAGYGDSFEDFFNKYVNPRYGQLTDQAGKNTYGVFSETQTRCIGYFDYSQVPDFGSKKDSTEVWEIEIPYVLRYDKPKDMYMSYPITIHNSVLSSKYRGTKGMDRMEDYQQSTTMSLGKMTAAAKTYDLGKLYKNFPGRYYPLFDEFMPRNIVDNSVRIFTTLVLLNQETDPDPLLLMNITDLEDPQYGLMLNDCIKNFMKEHHAVLTDPRQSPIVVSLYMGRLLMDSSFITVDENLNIRSTIPLNKRKYYHIRVSMLNDLRYLNQEGTNRLKQNYCVLRNLLEYVSPENSQIPQLEIKNGFVHNYDSIVDWLNGKRYFHHMRTVQNTKITAVYDQSRRS